MNKVYNLRENGSKNKSFKIGQCYNVTREGQCRVMKVADIKGGYVTFIDTTNPDVKCVGELYSLTLPCAQSCNIYGCDMVYSYDVLERWK